MTKINDAVAQGAAAAELLYPSLAAAWNRVLNRQVAAACKHLEQHAITAAAVWAIPDADEIDRRIAAEQAAKKATDPLRVRIVEAAMSGVLQQFDLDFDAANPLAQHVFLQLGKKITQINGQTRLLIMDAIQHGHDKGLSVPDTAALVRRQVGGLNAMRATRIARTEMTTGTNAASLAAVRLVDEGHLKAWLATDDERTRPTHAQAMDDYADGVPLTQPFLVGGSPMQAPGDPDGPAEEVVNCRCSQLFLEPATTASGYALLVPNGGVMRTKANLDLARRLQQAAAPEAPAETVPEEGAGDTIRWEATLLTEGVPSIDLRLFAPDSLDWRDLPLTLMGMFETPDYGGHAGAVVVGRIDAITREGKDILASGVFDDGEDGARMAELVADGTVRGVSIDFMIHEAEIIEVTKDTIEEGEEVDYEDIEYQLNITSATIVGATVCPMQAFNEGLIAIAASAEGEKPRVVVHARIERLVRELARPSTLTASALGVPRDPPAEWFAQPEPGHAIPLTILDSGQVYGHAAEWGTCHTANPEGPGVCTTAPRSACSYAYFNLKTRRCADGTDAECGTITLGTRHANLTLARQAAAEHYDHTGHAVADVRAVDGEHGIWVCGAVRPDITADQLVELRGAAVSGDWRPIQGAGRELIALLAVNVPGFPVPRPATLAASGAQGGLIAAGVVTKPKGQPTRREAASAALAALAARAEGGLDALLELAEA